MASLLSLSLPKPSIIKATSLSPTTLTSPEILEDKFGRKGFKFLESNNIPFVELKVRNGSSLRLQIPDAHVTSYSPKVYWKDDGFHELLYTIPPRDSISKSKGGIALVLNDASDSGSKGSLTANSQWSVKDVDNDSIDALQVELECTSGNLDITYIVSLYPESIATAVIVENNGKKPVTLNSAILSHLKFKKRDRAAIKGFKTCSYVSQPPLPSPFEILSPGEAMKSESPGLFDFNTEPEDKPGIWRVQEVPFTILKNKFSRIYAAYPQERSKAFYNSPPSKYEIIDQGVELDFRMIRMGFEDTYIGSPGSLSEKYVNGKEYFVCIGPASMLVPVVIKPGEDWRGAQVIEHENL